MPLYEYSCQTCHRKTTILVRSPSQAKPPTCPHCGGIKLVRVMSSFAYHKGTPSGESADSLGDPGNIGRWMETRLKELGTDMTPELKEMVGKAREGEVDHLLEEKGLREVKGL